MDKKRDQWTSKIGFILAAAGSAVGLGNIWKFPGKAYAGGGAVYLVTYLLVVFFIGLPVMISELTVGRHSQKNNVGAFAVIDKRFKWVGSIGVFCTTVIFCYYTHVGGWVLKYIFSYIKEASAVMDGRMNYFYNLLGYNATDGTTFIPWGTLIFAVVYIAMNGFIIIKGVSNGIEKFNKIGMPALFIILIILLIRTITLPGSAEGLKYMLSFDISKFSAQTVISALGQAFYSLSLGMAIMTTYGSYLSKDEHIVKNASIICTLDTLVAFMAGFIIVPAVISTLGANAVGKGGGFAFGALGGVFKAMPAGGVFGCLFYVLLFFAAISSSISIAEGIIAFATEEWGIERKKATIILCVLAVFVGSVYTVSQAAVSIKLPWIDFTGLHMVAAGDWMEYFTDRLLLPVAAFGESIVVGWIWKPENAIKEIGYDFKIKKLYSFCMKFICPAAIAVIIIYSFATGTTIS